MKSPVATGSITKPVSPSKILANNDNSPSSHETGLSSWNYFVLSFCHAIRRVARKSNSNYIFKNRKHVALGGRGGGTKPPKIALALAPMRKVHRRRTRSKRQQRPRTAAQNRKTGKKQNGGTQERPTTTTKRITCLCVYVCAFSNLPAYRWKGKTLRWAVVECDGGGAV